jgi:trigger factor
MKISRENTENCQAVLTVEAEPAEMDKALDQAYHHLVKKVSIPGFRKGKTPRSILVQHIGQGSLLEEALEHLVPDLYRQALDSEGLEPIARPEVEVVQTEPVVFKATVPLKPEVTLGDYHGIKLESEPVPAIGEEEVAAALDAFRERQGAWVPVERPAQPGDLVTIDVEASLDGKPWLNRQGVTYEVDAESRFPAPGFSSHLQGMEKTQEKEFSLTLPDDYPITEMRGKEGAFKVTVTEIKEKELPELDDGLAQTAGYEGLAAMKEKVTAELAAQAEARQRVELREKALDALVEISQVSYPPIMEDGEIAAMVRDEAQRLGFKEVEDYLKASGRTGDELAQALRPAARKRLTQGLVLGRLAEQEGIEVSPSDIDNRVSEIADDAEDKEKAAQFFSHPRIRQSLEQSMHTQKTMDRLLEITIGKVENATKEE